MKSSACFINKCLFCQRLQSPLHFYFFKGFYNISNLDVCIILNGQSALHIIGYFFHIIFIAFQTTKLSGKYYDAISNQTDAVVPGNFTFDYNTTCHRSLIKFVHFLDFHIGQYLLFNSRFQHTFHCTPDFLMAL